MDIMMRKTRPILVDNPEKLFIIKGLGGSAWCGLRRFGGYISGRSRAAVNRDMSANRVAAKPEAQDPDDICAKYLPIRTDHRKDGFAGQVKRMEII
jgi:hypothetical protein